MFGDRGGRLSLLVAAAVLVAVGVLVFVAVRTQPAGPNAIVVENEQPGSDAWRLLRPGYQVADDIVGQIKGYASATSANKGSTLTFYVSVAPAQSATIDVYRMGWYGGKGGRLMQRIGPLHTTQQATCPIEPLTGMIACAWTPTYTLGVPRDWTSGAYLAVLTNDEGYQNYIPFVVRDDAHTGGLLYKQPVNTYQAYNNYPDDGTRGKSLYDFNSFGLDTLGRTRRAVKVSFDRPYAQNGAGDFLKWEYNLIRWLERSGYDLTYITDSDYDAWPGRAFREKALLSAGHDEYWTERAYTGAFEARDGGIPLTFFASNAIYWQARYEPSPEGIARRVLVCWRDERLDPIEDPRLKTVLWRGSLARPEQALIGVSYSALLDSNAPYVVTASNSWVYAGSGLRDGDQVAGIVGYETDSHFADLPDPEHRAGTYELLSASPVQDSSGNRTVAGSSIYQATSGAWVFASGTTSWSWALDADGYFDSRIERATANVIDTIAQVTRSYPQPVTRAGLYSTAVLQDHPLAFWQPAGKDGWRLADASGNHFDGLVSGALSVEGEGAIASARDAALVSDGSAKVTIRTIPPVVDFSIEGWTNLSDATWNSSVLFNNALYGAVSNVRMLVRPGGDVTSTHGYFGVWLDGTEFFLQPSALTVSNVDTWVHWVLTRRADTLTLYRNGVAVAERSDLPPTAVANLSGTLFRQTEAFPLKGGVDSVAVYDSALSGERVREHFDLARSEPGAPVITPNVRGQAGANGWYVSDVTLDWQYDAGGFAVDSVTGCQAATLSQESPGDVHTCSVTTAGGTTTSTVTLMRDSTPPSILFTGNRGTYSLDQSVAISCTVLDPLSGPATPNCEGANGPAYTFGAGVTTLTATGSDNAGNTRTSSATFTVQVTSEGLCTVSRRFSLNEAVGRSLCNRLTEANVASGPARDEAVDAYVREVEAQAGQALLREQAELLSSLARALYP